MIKTEKIIYITAYNYLIIIFINYKYNCNFVKYYGNLK